MLGTSAEPDKEEDELTKLLKGAVAPSEKQTQESLLQQLKASLSMKKDEEANKALLKALITEQNRIMGGSGANTLKPSLLSSIIGEEGAPPMASWLANLNSQEEGESNFFRNSHTCEGEGDCKHNSKTKSGMLDKATTQIQHKQVWPQKNLGKDWADEDVEFKQLRFEHLVAGETRTIETCKDPAQILGRLKLLRQIAYLNLRGYEWHLLSKMYAAILMSIETAEYSWESNFDRFETILYRRPMMESRTHPDREEKQKGESRKHYCRDDNRPEGCPKNSPHPVWSGTERAPLREWSTTIVQHASLGTKCPKSTQRVTQSAPTRIDYRKKGSHRGQKGSNRGSKKEKEKLYGIQTTWYNPVRKH